MAMSDNFKYLYDKGAQIMHYQFSKRELATEAIEKYKKLVDDNYQQGFLTEKEYGILCAKIKQGRW